MTIGLLSFSCAAPVASWSPSVNPRRGGYAQGEEHYQGKDFAGSDLYSYDHGGPPNVRILEWEMLPTADMTTLLAFLTAMHGGIHTFSFTDYDSTVFATCRVLNSQAFNYKPVAAAYYAVTLEIEVA